MLCGAKVTRSTCAYALAALRRSHTVEAIRVAHLMMTMSRPAGTVNQRVVADGLVGGEQIQNCLRQVVAIATTPVGFAGADGDLHGRIDVAGTLGTQFPTGRALPFFGVTP